MRFPLTIPAAWGRAAVPGKYDAEREILTSFPPVIGRMKSALDSRHQWRFFLVL